MEGWRWHKDSNWRDKWLPTPTTYKIQSVPIPQLEDSWVAMLINKDTKMWDLSLLHELFQPKEVKVIANMPISPFLPPDRLIWQGTKNSKHLSPWDGVTRSIKRSIVHSC